MEDETFLESKLAEGRRPCVCLIPARCSGFVGLSAAAMLRNIGGAQRPQELLEREWGAARGGGDSCFAYLFKNYAKNHSPKGPIMVPKSSQEGPELASKIDKTFSQTSIIV